MITLGFYGAAGEVTGSCYVVTTQRARVMVDFGMHQGEREADEHNRRMPPIEPGKLDCVVLTHAHLDHCGRLPMLTQAGFRRPIYCTAGTRDLTELILRDSAKLQEDDCERFNRRLRTGDEPCESALYTQEDVVRTLPLMSLMGYEKPREIAPGITIKFVDAGHILGSTSVLMTIVDDGRSVNLVFSADVGVKGSPILRDPETPRPADVVVLESTYGDRDHKSLEATVEEFLEVLRDAQRAGAKVLIPAFAVGRTQDLVFHMGEFLRKGMLRDLRVFVDSPMATESSDLYLRHQNLYDDRAKEILAGKQSPLRFPGLTYTRTIEESKRLNEARGCMVIISASGMCTGGRIVHHLFHNLGDENTRVVFVGYQGQGTLGRRLVDRARRVRIFRQDIEVKAHIHTLGGFSAHAGRSGLLNWAAPFAQTKPRVFLTHGEDGPRTALRAGLKDKHGLDAEMPLYGDVVTL